MLAGLVLIGGATSAAQSGSANDVVARLGSLTVTASGLHPSPSHDFTSRLRITTSGMASDQLDAALAPGDAAVGVYHQQVNVGEIPDLASCDGDIPAAGIVDNWLHYGPLLVPGRSSGPSPPASATLAVPIGGAISVGNTVAVTLYFAHAGQVVLHLPVEGV
jgi:hypothetical protein